MTQIYDLTGNTLHADGFVGDVVVGGAVTGDTVAITADMTLVEALQEIIDNLDTV